MILRVRKLLLALTALSVVSLGVSCAGGAKTAPDTRSAPPQAEPVAASASVTPPAEQPQDFDPKGVTAEVKTATFVDVRSFIDSLNQIIRNQDYDAWLSHLSDDYVKYYSNPDVLAKYSEYPIMKRQGITLTDLHDYFVYVVYPSRQNDKVDDIEFVSTNLIKAITINSKGDRNILYMLEKHGDTWKIGIGR